MVTPHLQRSLAFDWLTGVVDNALNEVDGTFCDDFPTNRQRSRSACRHMHGPVIKTKE